MNDFNSVVSRATAMQDESGVSTSPTTEQREGRAFADANGDTGNARLAIKQKHSSAQELMSTDSFPVMGKSNPRST